MRHAILILLLAGCFADPGGDDSAATGDGTDETSTAGNTSTTQPETTYGDTSTDTTGEISTGDGTSSSSTASQTTKGSTDATTQPGSSLSSSSSAPPADLLFDTFDTGLDGWAYAGHDGFVLEHTTEHGGSATIGGDDDPPAQGTMVKVVDLITWDRSELTLEFDGRAQGGSQGVPHLRVWVFDGDTEELLVGEKVIDGGTLDSGWLPLQVELGPYVKNAASIRLELGMVDSWATEWGMRCWVDNVRLF